MSFLLTNTSSSARAGELAFALAACVYDLREHIRLAQDQNVVGAELDLGPAVLREDDLVPLGDVHLDVFARLLVAGAGPDCEDFAPLRLFLRRVGQDDAPDGDFLLLERLIVEALEEEEVTVGGIVLLERLDDQAVAKRL